MSKRRILALSSVAFFVLASISPAFPQKAPASPVEDRRKALNAVFHDYWEFNLETSPEFASIIGDKRYNDKITDYSVKAYQRESGPRSRNS